MFEISPMASYQTPSPLINSFYCITVITAVKSIIENTVLMLYCYVS